MPHKTVNGEAIETGRCRHCSTPLAVETGVTCGPCQAAHEVARRRELAAIRRRDPAVDVAALARHYGLSQDRIWAIIEAASPVVGVPNPGVQHR